MFVFGHLGIGSKLVSPMTRGLSYRWVLFSAILPDLMDKTLYQIASHTFLQDFVRGGRSFGHTAIFALLLAVVAFARKSKIAAALALGVTSHLVLDQVSDVFIANATGSGIEALLWPFLGWQFPMTPYKNVAEQLASGTRPIVMIAEVLGAAILAWDYWKLRHRREIQAVGEKFNQF